MPFEFRLLGPLEVEGQTGSLPLGGPKERALLGLLVLHANEVVSRDLLIARLWCDPPAGAVHALEERVSMLRKRLPEAKVVTKPGGYVLEVEPERVDLKRFEILLGQGRQAIAQGELRRAEELLSAALGCWRGPVLADIAYEQVALAETASIEEE